MKQEVSEIVREINQIERQAEGRCHGLETFFISFSWQESEAGEVSSF